MSSEKRFGAISNKSLVVFKSSLIIAVLIGLVVFIASTVTIFANSPDATIWTTDVDENNKTDFSPEEIVYIHGSGFNPDDDFTIEVTRPDGEIQCSSDIAQEDGTFVYDYDLNGITGEYSVVATDRSGNLATTIFADAVCSNIACTSDSTCYNRCDGSYWYHTDGYCSSYLCSDHCRYDNRVCADSNSGDGVPNVGDSVRTCGATCDQDSDCSNVCDGKKTKPGDCLSDCTCGTSSPICIQDSCGAICDQDSDCGTGQVCIGCECVVGARLNPQHDTYVRNYSNSQNVNTNYDDGDIHVKWKGSPVDRRRSYFKFDLSGIPDGATITSAILRLSQFDADATDTIGVYKVSNDKTTGGAWIETDLTWNNAPTDWSTGATTSIDSNDGYKELTVATADVQSSLAGNILSLAVRFSSEVTSKHHDFCDMEGTGGECDSTTKPELVIEYTTPPTQVCGNGIVEGTEQCDPSGDCCDTDCMFKTNTYECRQSAGQCDIAEYCTGSSATCPADSKSTALCRASAGDCDIAEFCDGVNNDCPTDTYKSSSFECRPAVDTCDIAEYCTGSGPTCSANSYQQEGTDCGICAACDGSGDCDVYDATQDSDCPLCQECSALFTCGNQPQGSDVKNECSEDACKYGYCDGSGACEMKPAVTDCGTCALCDGSGNCDVYDATQDSDCPLCQECSALDTCSNVPTGTDPKNDCIGNCDYCSESGSCIGDDTLCIGNCDYCSGSGNDFNCASDETVCEAYKCADCTGSGTSFSCTYDSTENEDCPVTSCPDSCNIDAYPFTWDYAGDVSNYCQALDTCTNNECVYQHDCHDNDAGDGIDGNTCSAECDGAGVECQPHITGDTCYYDGSCNTDPTVCACGGYFEEYCPEAGTVDDTEYGEDYCYYGSRDCVDSQSPGGCTLNEDAMVCNDYCNVTSGPQDTIGPVTSDVVVTPWFNGGIFDINATVNDSCSNIKTAEYFLGWLGTAGCSGTGTTIYPGDDETFNEDKKVEYVFADDVVYAVHDGVNWVCVRGQDTNDNWGNCACLYFEVDIVVPEEPVNIKLDDVLNPDEYLICGNNPILSAKVCDSQSYVQGGEYYIDATIPPLPTPWTGFWMNPSENWEEGFYWCANISAVVNVTPLDDGTHYIVLRGKDDKENWGKISKNISFIKDTTAPVTTKQLNPANGDKVNCSITDMNGHTITDGCYYVKQGTTITLTATDPDSQGTGEFAGNVVIYYKIYWSYDGSSWALDTEGQSIVNQPITLTLNKDSYHLIEYWSTDGCNLEETHHFELDIVDTQKPNIMKTIVGPQHGYCPPLSISDDCFIDGVTTIHVESTDLGPHPVDDVTCDWDYTVTGGTKTGTGQTGLTPPFDINFPEESSHELTIKCRDALGNEETDVEVFIVDKTPPTTTKTYGTPRYPDDIYHAKWITSQTPITLTVDDTGVHKSGIKETKYRVTLLGSDESCKDNVVCQEQTGLGTWSDYTTPFTIADESCHLIEYYSVDNVEKTETIKKQCVYVENTPPEIVKTVDTPKHECNATEKTQYGNPDYGCWYITQNTKITLDCDDVIPHPVDNVVLYYRDYLLGETTPSYTAVSGGYVDIYKKEDSEHVLEFYCVDALGNSQGTAANPHKEIDIVDTQKPVSQKTLGNPQHACTSEEQTMYYDPLHNPAATDGCYFINKSTPVTITCQDGQPHPVDHVKIWYRTYPAGTNPLAFIADSDNVTFTYDVDSAHVLEWYCVDELGNQETTHVEYDIVDTVPPVTTKNIIGPQFYNSTEGKLYIDGVTEIELTCNDPTPHPVDHADIYYRYRVNDSAWNSWTKYTGKFKFPEESKHELEYYCVDALGNEETHQFEIDYVDHTKPVTTKTYGTPYVSSDGKEWINSSTLITLTASDGTSIHSSGVKETKYRVTPVDDNYCTSQSACQDATGSGDFLTYTTSFTIDQQSCHLIEYYSKDNVDKTETVKKQCVYVENTAPQSSKSLSGTPHVCESSETLEGILDCSYITKNTDVTLTCNDVNPHPVDQVKIKYKIDWKNESVDSWTLGSWQETGSQITFNYPEDSYHKLTWYCVDALGNEEKQHVELDIVDTVPPVSIKSFDGVHTPCSDLKCAASDDCNYYITNSTKIILTCTDQDPHPVDHQKIYYRYTVDNQPHAGYPEWTLYTGPIQYDEDSQHTLEWYCVDELGNKEDTHTQIERVDSTPPVTTKTVGDPKWGAEDYWVTSHTPITLTTTDKESPCASGPSTLYYEVWWDSDCNGTVDSKVQDSYVTTDTNCKLEKTIYLNEECLHEIRWYAVDALGNAEQIHTQLHKVDNTPPHILILKPVDGWYSDGEDIPIVSVAEDLTNPHTPCTDPLSGKCAVGIKDGKQCYAYLIDLLPQFNIVELNTEGTFLYNATAHECQGYATIPSKSEITDGVVLLAVSADDNLGNMGDSLQEIYHTIMMSCGVNPVPECVMNVVQDIVTIWNLPKIGIDNHAPEVTITEPIKGTLFGGEQVYFSTDVIDSNDGDVTSTITTGTPCYVTIGGVSLGTVPYNNENRKCTGTIMIPQDEDFPQGPQDLKVEIADNAGNIGSNTVNVIVDTTVPTLDILTPANNQFVSGNAYVSFNVFDATSYDPTKVELSLDNGQTWILISENNPNFYQYYWNTTVETDGMAYGIIARATDGAGNIGYSEVVIVIVDNGAPEGVYVVDPIKNDIVQGTITLKALATDYVSGIQSVKIYVLSPVVGDCDATLTDGTWQCTFDSTTKNDGQHEVYAVATDSLGHETTSAHVPFIIDNYNPSKPTISVVDTDGDGYDTDGTVTWSWTESTDEGSEIAYYEFMASDKPEDVATKVLGTFFTTSDLIDGTYTAKVRAVDKAGHVSDWSKEVSIIIDTISPSALTIYGTGIEKPPYDTNGNYDIKWNGGTDTNLDRYELYENDSMVYSGSGNSLSRNSMPEGNHRYQVKSYDKAGHQTVSSFFDVFVDIVPPSIIPGTQQSAYPLGWFAPFTVEETGSGVDTISYSTDALLPPICMFNINTGSGYCYMIGGGEFLIITVKDKAGWEAEETIERGPNSDFTPPELLTSGPSGVINYNGITLTATTNEPSICKYGTSDDYSTMITMDGSGMTSHSANLGTLTDGYKVYHIKCEDMVGNKMEHSKTIVFYIDTTGNFELVIPDYGHYWSLGWNTFFLPEDMLDDICGGGGSYPVKNVLSSLDGSDPAFNMVWYFDGEGWLYYDPANPGLSTLTQFNDVESLPYYIRMIREDRLEINLSNCLV